MSLMIPRVFPQWVNEEKIIKIFEEQQIGIVYKVSIRLTKNEYKKGKRIPIYKAYVYFHYWFNNQKAYNFQQEILKTNQARIVYDAPWFWTIFENKQKKPSKKDVRIMRIGRKIYRQQYECPVENSPNEDDAEHEVIDYSTITEYHRLSPYECPAESECPYECSAETEEPSTIQTHASIEESILNSAQTLAEEMVEQVLNDEDDVNNIVEESSFTSNHTDPQVGNENTHAPMAFYPQYLSPRPPPMAFYPQYLPPPPMAFYHPQYLPSMAFCPQSVNYCNNL